jgi:hypothetical protein
VDTDQVVSFLGFCKATRKTGFFLSQAVKVWPWWVDTAWFQMETFWWEPVESWPSNRIEEN